MGSYDGAEVCETVGLYLLTRLQPLGIPLGLYCDDGLAISDKTPRQAENDRKRIVKIFEEEGLKITSQANLDKVDFLDISLDLVSGMFQPYMKPGNNTVYVDVA